MMERRRILIVSGPMRSGTTMLSDLLHAGSRGFRHPKLAVAPDSLTSLRQITESVRSAGELALMDPEPSRKFIEDWSDRAEAAWPQFIADVKAAAPTPEEPEVLGVKTTGLLPELLALARRLGERARFVIMIRDPRDIVSSSFARYKKSNPDPSGFETGFTQALMNAAFLFNYEMCRGEKSFLFMRYEDLVADPEAALREILGHAGLDADEYDWQRLRAGDVISNSSFRDIGPDDTIERAGVDPSIGNFRRLSEEQLETTEALFRDFCRRWGYKVGGWRLIATQVDVARTVAPAVAAEGSKYGYNLVGLNRSEEAQRSLLTRFVMRTPSAQAALESAQNYPSLSKLVGRRRDQAKP